MAKKVVSAYADAEVVSYVERLAKLENRPVGKVAEAALEFWIALPPEAHAALRQIRALGTEGDQEALARDVARLIIAHNFEVAVREAVAAMPERPGDREMSEDELLADAVRMTAPYARGIPK